MSASNYLPPFTPEERVAIAGDQVPGKPVGSGMVITDPDVTYADFLVDQVDD